jgi:hypothetical protein
VRSRKAQQGMTLIVIMTVIVMGLAWYVVGALGKAAPTTADKEIRTGAALHAAKQALLTYVANYAAQTVPLGNPETMLPGRLPCPEPLSPAAGGEGIAAGCTSNVTTYMGRLPWRTLGVDQIRDGDSELLWYVLGPGFRQAPINFGTAGQLTVDVGASPVVALIIAPGRPINTASEPGPPPAACPAVGNQHINRYATPFDPAKFLECGRGNAVTNHTLVTPSPWTNDRAIAITAAEVMEAISGPVADRIQRQVAPALEDWRQTESFNNWGTRFLPWASTFGDPATNDYCGDAGVHEGLPPLAAWTMNCARWTATSSLALGLVPSPCTQNAAGAQCTFLHLFAVAPLSAHITATTQIDRSFRERIAAADVQVSNGGSVVGGSFSLNADPATGIATVQFDVSWPALGPSVTVSVTVPHLPDAAILSDSRLSWFINNDWERFTYYAIIPGVTIGAAPPALCMVPANPGCVDYFEVRGYPTTGNYTDKRLVLVLAGMPLPGQDRSCPGPGCGVLTQYLEEQNASANDRIYRADLRIDNPVGAAVAPPSPLFNDRVAACPFQYTPQTGPPISICN